MLAIEPDRKKAGHLLLKSHKIFTTTLIVVALAFPFSRIPILIGFLPFYIMHVMYMKCPITHVEKRLHTEDVETLDPLMSMFHISHTELNRARFQAIFSSILFVIIVNAIIR